MNAAGMCSMDMFESRVFTKGSDLPLRGLSFTKDTLVHCGEQLESLSVLFVKSCRWMNWALYTFPFTYQRVPNYFIELENYFLLYFGISFFCSYLIFKHINPPRVLLRKPGGGKKALQFYYESVVREKLKWNFSWLVLVFFFSLQEWC